MHDGLTWAEEVANTTLLGVLAKPPGGYTSSGDYIVLKKGMGDPILFGLGGVSDTKPNGTGLQPQYTGSNAIIYGPAGIDFSHKGWHDMRQMGGIRLQAGEQLTGLMCDTNVNEGQVVLAHVGYGGLPKMNQPLPHGNSFVRLLTVTSAAAVTRHSGSVALDTGIGDMSFLNTKKNYLLVGLVPHISAATLGGALSFEGLSGNWFGYHPAFPLNPLSAVTFGPGAPYYFPEPIPVGGEEFDSVTAGVCATTAGAITVGLIIREL